ncbi:hypothetical protein [Microbulbifer variabilis]|uniref:hypothetical protein n=1 Tax=Microbulbifer variabilis TaxID=266805 RepID=UPI001CFC4E04|nr:hypothetical protein [Microbulbifer variabilis]
MTVKRIKLEDIKKSRGSTDKKTVDSMTEADINKGIISDPDSPNLNDEELKEFKPVPKGGENEKNQT